jgi:hypothetical protein
MLANGVASAQGPPAYCFPNATDSTAAGDFIDGVQVGDLSNLGTGLTGGPGYADLRYVQPGLATHLVAGAQYALEVVAGDRAGTAYAAWIDLDQDLDLEPGERLGDFVSTGPGNSTVIPFTLPADATRGYTLLRVRCAFTTDPVDPCATYTHGETEDYTVVIEDGSGCIPLLAFGNTNGEHITGVALNTFSYNQPAPDPAPYVDNRHLGAMLSIGITYNLSVTVGSGAGQLAAALLDLNGDGDLDDAGEQLGQAYASAPFQTVVFTFPIPAGTAMGQRLLRVRCWDSGLPADPCADRLSGETEDYTVGLRHPNFLCFPVAGGTQGGIEIADLTVNGGTFTSNGGWPYHTVHDTVPVRLPRGEADVLSLTSGTHVPTRFQLWVDANLDGDFNDPGENLATAVSTTPGQALQLPFTLPASMPAGQTHLRLRCSDGNATAPTSCGASTAGEIEDVVIVVVDPAGPCIPHVRTWTQQGTYIDGVMIGAIANTGSGALRGPAYSDLRTQRTPLDPGASYDMQLTAGTDSLHVFDAFLDANGDGDLDDSDEHLGRVTTTTPGGQATLTFTVPVSAVPDTVLLRIRVSDASAPLDGCGDLPQGRGETEDYGAVVSNTTSVSTIASGDLHVRPLPEAGLVLVDTPEHWRGGELLVLDALGRVLHNSRVTGTRMNIPAATWSPGVHFIRVLTPTGPASRPFIWP